MFELKLKPLAGKLTLAILLAACLTATAGTVHAETGGPADQSQKETPGPSQNETKQHHHHGHFRGGHIVKDTAELMGVEPNTVMEQLKQGKTLLQIVQASKGWSEEEYLKKLTETANRNIDKALAEGKIDREKASEIKAKLPEKLKKVINRSFKDRGPGQPTADYQNNQVNWNHLPH